MCFPCENLLNEWLIPFHLCFEHEDFLHMGLSCAVPLPAFYLVAFFCSEMGLSLGSISAASMARQNCGSTLQY